MLRILGTFFAFCGTKNRRKFYLAIALSVISAFSVALRIPASALIIQGIVHNTLSLQSALISFCIMAFSVALASIINTKSTMLQTEAGYNTCANKRIEIAEHLRYLPMGYFNKNSLGQITSVTTNTMENLANVATRVVMMSTRGIITTSLIAIMMLFFDVRMGCITIVGIIIFFSINGLMQLAEHAVSKRKVAADEELVNQTLEYIQGIAEVKNYNLIKTTSSRIYQAIKESNVANFAMEIPSVVFMFLQHVVTKATGTILCLASIYLYLHDSMTLVNCIVMLICSFMIYESLDSAGSFSALFKVIDMSVSKANEILALPVMDIDGKEITPVSTDINLRNVSFSYDTKKIIDDVSLDIPAKTTTAFVGPSGSGKSTLCNLIARFWDVQSGEVVFGGHSVKEYSYDSLLKNFSFVFQRTYLFNDTVANNIRFGNPDASMDSVIAAAKKAQCHDFIMKLPQGYETVLGEGGASISGGEKQRITIARAILKDAPVIILDEATANVDPENEQELMAAITELTKDKTVIMIAHRLKTVEKADQIFVINNGKIVQQGKHADLLTQDGIYRRFVVERRQAVGWKL